MNDSFNDEDEKWLTQQKWLQPALKTSPIESWASAQGALVKPTTDIVTARSVVSKKTSGSGPEQPGGSPTTVSDLNKVWKDEESRVMEILGGAVPKHIRAVEDKLALEFTKEEWRKLFNLEEGYEPSNSQYVPFTQSTVVIHFIRQVKQS